MREKKPKTPVAHNIFRFDSFFLLKGLRASVWRTRDVNIGGKSPKNINFAIIGNQVMFLDEIFSAGLRNISK